MTAVLTVAGGSTVGTLSATDPDSADTHGFVLVAVAHHLHHALFQPLDLLAQHLGLALLQAHGTLAVRAGELHAGQHLGVALEEAGRAQQKVGDVFFGDRGNVGAGHRWSGMSIWPSNTVVAGPVM